MSRPIRAPLAAVAITTSLLAGTVMTAPVVAQQSTSSGLALPGSDDAATDAALVTQDVPALVKAPLDLNEAATAAIELLDRMPEDEWTPAGTIGALGEAPAAAFEFVRDSIGFDPYAGVLRGAGGTLGGGAGNAVDRALLLQGILRGAGHTTRLAQGELDETTAQRVLERARLIASRPSGEPSTTEVTSLDIDALRTRARRDYALVSEALVGWDALFGAEALLDASDDVRVHTWLQLQTEDGSWVDLDPTLPDTAYGDRLVEPAMTFEEPLADDYHEVGVRILVESFADGALTEAVVLDEVLVAADVTDQDVWLHFQPEGAGVGGVLAEAFDATRYQPVISTSEGSLTGSGFAIDGASVGEADADAGGDLGGGLGGGLLDDVSFGEEPGTTTQLASIRAELTSFAPGLPDLTSERVLFDRIPPEARAAGVIAPESLAPLPADGIPSVIDSLHHLMISTGSTDKRRLAEDRAAAALVVAGLTQDPELVAELSIVDTLLPVAVTNRSLMLGSEDAVAGGISTEDGSRAIVRRPRLFMVSLIPDLERPGVLETVIDLALDDIGILPAATPDAASAAQLRVWYGALQTALETETGLRFARALDAEGRAIAGVSLATPGGLELVTPDRSGDVPSGAPSLQAALASGELALVAGEMGPGAAFWAVDPATGATRSIIEPGMRLLRAVGSIGGTQNAGSYLIRDGVIYDLNRRRVLTPLERAGCGKGEYLSIQCIGSALRGAVVEFVIGVGLIAYGFYSD